MEVVWNIVAQDDQTKLKGASRLRCNLKKISTKTFEVLFNYINKKLCQYESNKDDTPIPQPTSFVFDTNSKDQINAESVEENQSNIAQADDLVAVSD